MVVTRWWSEKIALAHVRFRHVAIYTLLKKRI